MMTPLVDRLRALPPSRRATIFADLAKTPGALSDIDYNFEGFWAREDQIVTLEELERYSVIVFAGPRGAGKTKCSVHLWLREILAGRSTRPRIVAATEADVDKTVVHGLAGIMHSLPKHLRPVWRAHEGFAGTLRFQNGVEAMCFGAKNIEQMVGTEGDLDLMDDPAKWGPNTEYVWRQARTSCRKGRGLAIVATTRRGSTLFGKILKPGEGSGMLIRRLDSWSNKHNLTAGFEKQRRAEFGDSDFFRQELEDEDISASSPFGGIDFDAPPVRILEVQRADLAEVIVSVDPSDGKGGDHDEWGIGAAGRRTDRHVVALDDATGSYDEDEACARILDMCEAWGVTKIIAEVNRGENRVRNGIRASYYQSGRRFPLPEVIGVTARDGKRLRAGPLRALYLQGMLHHVAGLKILEKQQREWEPDGPKRPRQDDHIDWLVHAVHYLAALGSKVHDAGPQLNGLAARVQAVQPTQGNPSGVPGLALQRSAGLPAWDQRSDRYRGGGGSGGGGGLGSRRVF